MQTITSQKKSFVMFALLIGTTACGDAMNAPPVEEPQTRLGTPVFFDPVVQPEEPVVEEGAAPDEVKVVGRIDDPVFTDAWTGRDERDSPFDVDVPTCSDVTRRVVLSADQIAQTRDRALDQLQAQAFTLCGGFEQARLTDVTFEDVSFEEETLTICENSSGEQVDLPAKQEVFGTTVAARVICGEPMLRPTLTSPELGRPQPMPFEIHEVDDEPTSTVERSGRTQKAH